MCHLYEMNFSRFPKRPGTGRSHIKLGFVRNLISKTEQCVSGFRSIWREAKFASVRYSVSPSTDSPVFLAHTQLDIRPPYLSSE
jgi:hypothetical protein